MAQEAKPPYVMFEVRAVEDREATIAAGHYVAKDLIYAIITPAGSRDRIEKIATEWLGGLKAAVREERFPAAWLSAYEAAYKGWLETREVPEFGTSVTIWPTVSPAQVKMLLDLNLRTIEQVAEANEEALTHMGMGGRALKEKAKAWLDSSSSQGKISSELEALRTELKALKARDTEREAQLTNLTAENEALKKTLDKLENA